jgi:hypothetical protein
MSYGDKENITKSEVFLLPLLSPYCNTTIGVDATYPGRTAGRKAFDEIFGVIIRNPVSGECGE